MILCLKSNHFAFCDSYKKEIVNGEVFEPKKVMKMISNITSSEVEEKYIILEIEGKLSDFLNLEGERVEIFYFAKASKIMVRKMVIGKIKEANGRVYIELWELSFLLNQPVVEYFSKQCRASFCDKRCKLKEENFSIELIVADYFHSNLMLQIVGDLGKEKKLFEGGAIIFGEKRFLVSCVTEGNIFLFTNPYNVEFKKGDKIILLEGCDKTFETCKNRFRNSKNFAGEPFVFEKFSSSFFS